jgi:hypothetical protein
VNAPSPLSREERIKGALKILGAKAQRSDIEPIIDRIMPTLFEKWMSERSKLNFRGKKAFAKQYARALRKIIGLTEKAPPGFLPGFVPPEPVWLTSPSLGIYQQELNVQETLRNLKLLLSGVCGAWDEKNLKRGPKAAATPMRAAAVAASILCTHFQIKIKATRNGKACRLAAVLYGEPGADFRAHIKWTRKRHWEKTKQ